MESARGYRGKIAVPVALVLMALGLYYFQAPVPILMAVAVIGFRAFIQLHVTGLNRRLDSLLELLESDKKIGDE